MPLGRCKKYPDEIGCLGHDCIDRLGTPCVFDKHGTAGTDDVEDNPCPRDYRFGSAACGVFVCSGAEIDACAAYHMKKRAEE